MKEIILRQHTDYPCHGHMSCALCDEADEPAGTLAASLENTQDWVCGSCLDKHWRFAGLSKMIDVFNDLLFFASRGDIEAGYADPEIKKLFKQLRQLVDESREPRRSSLSNSMSGTKSGHPQ